MTMARMTTHSFSCGDRVRFVADALGIIDPARRGAQFLPETVGNGDTGTVLSDDLPDGWLAVEPDGYAGVYVPVHPGMIESL